MSKQETPSPKSASVDPMGKRVIEVFDRIERYMSHLPESREKTECIDSLMELRFLLSPRTEEAKETEVPRS